MRIKTQHVLEGPDGLEVLVPDGLDRLQTAVKLTQLAHELLAELAESEGGDEDDEDDEDESAEAEVPRVRVVHPEEPEEPKGDEVVVPESALEFPCPTCEQDEDEACVDTRPGREDRHMAGFHPERQQAYRDARDEAKAALRGQ
jgi:hypothetical protein